jgi:hypothetical protein
MSMIVRTDTVIRVPPGETPDYNGDNPLVRLIGYAEAQRLAAARHYYLTDDLQALVPFSHRRQPGRRAPTPTSSSGAAGRQE